jgi:CubicO group peptidase (beta-lactamase class C family)
VGEVVRRIDGRSLGRFWADEIARPLGLEWWIGLPEELHQRVAPLIGSSSGAAIDPEIAALIEQFIGPDTDLGKALQAPGGVFSGDGIFNRPEVWVAEIPAANGIATARSIARGYAGLVGPVEGGPPEAILDSKQVDLAREVQTSGPDRLLLQFPTTFGLGFMTSSDFAPFGGAGAFGHPGMGGSVGCVDPEASLSFGYAMNKMQLNLAGDTRTRTLLRAAYEAIGVEPVNV